jgi:hypothetical protein
MAALARRKNETSAEIDGLIERYSSKPCDTATASRPAAAVGPISWDSGRVPSARVNAVRATRPAPVVNGALAARGTDLALHATRRAAALLRRSAGCRAHAALRCVNRSPGPTPDAH